VLDHERERMSELRLGLIERLFEARVEAGQSTAVISELTGLCLDHPLREHLWASLITAQYRAGLQADALRSYDQLRRNLVERLGVSPSPPLRDLERRLLDQSPTLDATAPHDQPDRAIATGNLRGPPPQLIGRDTDRKTVIEELRNHRLVTITGVGGVGKTSLALVVAHEFAAEMDEVWSIGLAPLRDEADVLPTIAATLGVTAGTPTADDLVSVIRHRGRLLLILDNCEHLVDGVAEIARAFATDDRIYVLATSRVQLGAYNEQLIRLAPLAGRDDAIELFVREAARNDPAFSLFDDDAVLVEEICERVDRIPLAIELAAARSRSLGLDVIHRQLTELLDSPRSRPHADERHETMTATIHWSTDRLEPDLAACLGVLTVHAGTFDLDATAALVDLVSDRPAIEVVDKLIAESLIEPVRAGHRVRYHILEPVRQYAAGTLLTDPTNARDRHLEHFLDRLEGAYQLLGTTSDEPIREIIAHDLDNLRAVHGWALGSGRIEDDLRLYRPLMIANSHEVFEPGSWAVETMRIEGIEEHERWREALAIALGTAVFRSEWTLGEEATALLVRARGIGPGVGSDLVECQIAWVETMREGHHAEGVARWDAIETDDAFAIYLRWLMCPPYRAGLSDDPLAVGRADYADGIAWARSIGAASLEAGLLMMSVHIEQNWGEPQDAHDVADEAVRLCGETRMRHLEALAVFQRSQATLRGATSPHDPLLDILSALRGTVRVGGSYRLTQLLNIAAQLLSMNDRTEPAALAGIAGDAVSGWQWHWRDHIAEDAIERAAARIEREHLDVMDITDEVVSELDRLSEHERRQLT
jgi:predicted ATPase